ncbi:MAG TPA: ATP-binding protein [Polyangiaceae bacterium]|nr:ATP-binding protein [Polyangiaceae bacterium]
MHLKWLAGAFTLIAAVFIASAAMTYFTISGIDDEVSDLKRNSLPSVAELSAARAELQRARLTADTLTLSADEWSTQGFQELRTHEDSVRAHLAVYEQTPWYANERELYDGRLRPALEKLEKATTQVSSGGLGSARERMAADLAFDVFAGEVDEALTALLELNHSQSFLATENILNARRHYDQLALLLTLVSALVAGVAAAAVLQLMRRDQRRAQEALRHEAARSAELEMFASRVSHDLLSPLAAVTLSLAAIAKRHDDPPTRTAIERAQRTLERSRGIVQGIYEFARAGARPAKDARTSLRVGVRSAVDDFAGSGSDPGTEVNVEPLESVEVACCPGVLSVILSNLLSNAAKSMRESPVRRITVRARVIGTKACVEVEDTGPGVPPGLEASIFEPYVRAPSATQPGLGLGLATVKRLVEGHAGAVGVRRAAHGGAIFYFELPLVPPKADNASTAPGGLRPQVPAS